MTDREKLVELVKDICNTVVKACGCSDMLPTYSFNKRAVYDKIADHLLANGVVVQNWRDAKTDPPPIGKEVVMLFSDESTAIGWLEDIEEDGEPMWNVCIEQGWYTTSTCCPEKWQPRPVLPQKKGE